MWTLLSVTVRMWTLRTLHLLGFVTFASSKRNSSAWHNKVCDKVRCFIKKVKGMDGVVNDISYSHHRFNRINYCNANGWFFVRTIKIIFFSYSCAVFWH